MFFQIKPKFISYHAVLNDCLQKLKGTHTKSTPPGKNKIVGGLKQRLCEPLFSYYPIKLFFANSEDSL